MAVVALSISGQFNTENAHHQRFLMLLSAFDSMVLPVTVVLNRTNLSHLGESNVQVRPPEAYTQPAPSDATPAATRRAEKEAVHKLCLYFYVPCSLICRATYSS